MSDFYRPCRRRRGAAGPDEMEVLQTDVMRFFAILCLILMAIFALVQSLPVASAPTRPRLRAMDRPPPERVETPAPERVETPAPEPAEAPPGPAPAPMEKPEKEEPPAPETPPAPPQKPPKEGFALRFRSDRALAALVETDRVALYAMTAGGAWRFRISGGAVRIAAAEKPRRYYEMDPETAPDAFARALRNGAAIFDRDAATWGVVLPAEMEADIRRTMAGKTGGVLVIQRTGNVVLSEKGE